MKRLFVLTILVLLAFGLGPVHAGRRGTIATGFKLNTPQILALSLTAYPYHFWLVQMEPGIGGGKLNVGLGGNWHYTIGAAIKVSLLQTWLTPIGGVEPGQTYAGGEGELMWQGVNMSFGLYSHVSGTDPKRDMLVSVGIGIGF